MKYYSFSTVVRIAAARGVLGVILSAPLVQAEVTMDWASVEDAGNVADSSTGYGAVGYNYEISKHEVTIGQYATFLNSVAGTDTYSLYNTSMGTDAAIAGITRSGSSGSYTYATTGSADRPITYVSWFDAARFTNWMENGQGAGDTETGVYALSGATSGVGFTADANASLWIPTEDEWYKAAYYDPSKGEVDGGNNYHLYAAQSSALPSNDLPDAGNNANFDQSGLTLGGPGHLTDVGAFASSGSYYGTFDQGGNVWEWNDAVIGSSRGLRGGAWGSVENLLRSSLRYNYDPSDENLSIGFRIASVPIASVPEPSSVALLSLGSLSLLLRRKRRSGVPVREL